MHLEGDQGTLLVNYDGKPLKVYTKETDSWETPEIHPSVKDEELETYGTGEAMKSFLSCITASPAVTEHPVSGKEYLKTLAVAFAAYESAQCGRPVTVQYHHE